MLQNFENFIYEESVNDEPFFAKLPMSVRNNFFFFGFFPDETNNKVV